MVGRTFGHYEVTAHLGSGGMGDVYQATDSRLGRQVAIKFLPDAVAKDAERHARFEREARLLASLNHPNIAAVHGFEEVQGRAFLVMELIPGETLAAQIARGPIPVRDALGIAGQIADALDAAHQRNVIHRDLKPANITITPDGKVKVLDFGLAKAFEVEASPGNLSHSPTLGVAATEAGMILGTAAYMSPEQARGRAVDKRTDIWSFACVLFEMLTGRQAFAGETASDTLARILEREPAWDALPSDTPAAIHRLIRRSLQKDARQRLHDIADARIEIEEAISAPTASSQPKPPRFSRRSVVVFAAAFALGTIALRMLGTRPAATEQGLIRFPVLLPAGEVAGEVAVSPDGRSLAMTTSGPRAKAWLRSLDVPEAKPIPGTDGASHVFWSPDGRSLGLIGRDSKVRRIDVGGGSPTVLAEGASETGGGAWNRDGVILFGAGNAIRRVSATGGDAVTMLLKDGAGSAAFRGAPRFLPDGQHFVYWLLSSGQQGSIRVGTLTSDETELIAQADSAAEYSTAGYLLFLRGAVLVAQAFDARTLRISGNPTPVAADAASGSLSVFASFSASGADTLAYVRTRGGNDGQLTWFDRSGRELGSIVPPAGSDYLNPSLSPDGTRLAVNNMDPDSGNWDIWVIDLESRIPTRVTSDPAQDSDAIWSPDSNEIVFVSNRGTVTTVANHTVNTNAWSRVADWISTVDADGDPVVQYQFLDTGISPDSGYFYTPTNTHVADNTYLNVDAADIGSMWVRGGNANWVGPNTYNNDRMWVRTFDGADYGPWEDFWLVTHRNTAPVVTMPDVNVGINGWASVRNSIASSDADGDSIMEYQFYDAGSSPNSAHLWTLAHTDEPSDSYITVSAADLGTTWIHGGNAAWVGPYTNNYEQMWVRGFDGTEWSAWDAFWVVTH
jgi:Tol biopolymer transport system component